MSGAWSVKAGGLVAAALFAGCTSDTAENRERADFFTEFSSTADFSEPADMAGLTGTAVYTGAAIADFGEFSGTADAQLTADFASSTISGEIVNWLDADFAEYDLDGQVVISKGTITGSSFAGEVAGNLERKPASTGTVVASPTSVIFSGTTTGTFYDSTSGAQANHLSGTFNGDGQVLGGDDVTVSGSFAATR